MHITVNLDPDAVQGVQAYMRDRNLSMSDAVNQIIRRSTQGHTTAFQTETASMGEPSIDLDHALDLVASYEDAELVRRIGDDS